MCGIVGIVGTQEPGWIEAMNAVQVHRGPDDTGLYRGEGVALAMRRLSIIDLAGGHQPMESDDGRFVLVYNGEIYNAPDLRRELEAAGERFRTDHSDTEVLLRLLMRRGEAALPLLNGMFAFAFLDRQGGTLLCARDRMGIKPFHWLWHGGRFAFASELKSLLALPFPERRVDRASLFHYFSLMYVPGDATILEGINRLPPGHLLRLTPGAEPVVERWWAPRFCPDIAVPAAEWPQRIAAVLEQAARRWTLSDVPIACSLSGGLDSSALVGFLSRAGLRLKTVSLGFSAPGEEDWNELPIARRVAEKWGTDHEEIVLDPERLLDDLPAMVWHLDEPYGGGLPSWNVFKAMSRSVKVGLSGTGGDELFGNYGKWRPLEGGPLARLLGRHPNAESFRRLMFERCYYLPDSDKRRLLGDAEDLPATAGLLWRHFSAEPGPVRDRMAVTDMETQLAEEFLMMTDRFSMAHSLEARTPFLDNAMVELALSIPAGLRTHRRDLKGLLRRAVADVLPPEAVNAPKKGFVIPLGRWLRGRLRPLCEQLLAPDRLAAQGLIRPDFHAAYVAPHLAGRRDHTPRVWAALMFQLWHKLYLERPDPTAAPPSLAELTA